MRICLYNVTASFIPAGIETYCWEVGRASARRGQTGFALVAGALWAMCAPQKNAARPD